MTRFSPKNLGLRSNVNEESNLTELDFGHSIRSDYDRIWLITMHTNTNFQSISNYIWIRLDYKFELILNYFFPNLINSISNQIEPKPDGVRSKPDLIANLSIPNKTSKSMRIRNIVVLWQLCIYMLCNHEWVIDLYDCLYFIICMNYI